MTNTDLKRTLFVTRRYSNMQGYRTLLGGVLLLLAPAWLLVVGKDSPSTARFILTTVVIAAALVAVFLVDHRASKWYEQKFGRVVQKPGDKRTEWLTGAIAFTFYFVGYQLSLTTSLDFSFALALLVVGISIGATINRSRFGAWKPVEVVAPVGIAIAALMLHLFGTDNSYMVALMLGPVGIALVVSGLLEHRMLERSLGAKESNVDAV